MATLQEQARQNDSKDRSGASDQHSVPPPTQEGSTSPAATPDGQGAQEEMTRTIAALQQQVDDLTYDLKKFQDFA